jgi:hypothetical protein
MWSDRSTVVAIGLSSRAVFTGRCDPSAAACCLPSAAILAAAEKKDPGLKVIELCHE